MQESICLLKKILKDGDAIVVGVSGGPDSMCLLSFLDVSVIGISLKIIVAHVNHNVRDTANKDEEFVRRFALEKKYIFEKYKIDKLKGNFEAEARKIRYDFFESLIKKYNAKYLFTAHHGDDLIETIIMRLIRGAAFKGYRGIDFIINKEGYKLVRPLLYMTKDEILNYLKINSIDYCIDETNDLDFNTRNRIRHHILPELKKENADVHKKFLEFSGLIKKIDDFLSAYTSSVLNDIYSNEELNLFTFNDLEDIKDNSSNIDLLSVYPIGSIYISYSSTNPSTLFGGIWEQIQGKFLLGVSSSYSLGSTGGSASTSLDFRIGGNFGLEGDAWKGRVLVSYLYYSGTPEFETRSIPTMPPYIAVYMWRRTA